MRAGVIPSAPLVPTFAVDIKLLDLYRSLNKFHRRLGLQPFVRAMHDFHDHVLLTASAHSFSRSYDCYLSIQRSVDTIINTSLGRADPEYRLTHACAACQYKTTREPILPYSLLCAADGNFSLRRFQKVGTSDGAKFTSSYFLPREVVNQFAKVLQVRGNNQDEHTDNIQDAQVETSVPGTAEENENPGGTVPLLQDTPEGSFGHLTADCGERWKANADDQKKVMWDCFDECGVFITVCRHGIVLLVCDIVKSGEL